MVTAGCALIQGEALQLLSASRVAPTKGRRPPVAE